mgnify:FL=1
MNRIVIPETYRPALGGYDLQCAIGYIKHGFQAELERSLRLKRVSAPLFVSADSGLNDDLSGTERPVAFDIPAIGKEGQIVHSLAKWKRLALKKYGFQMHEGLYADMNAVRRDEALDNLHSVYVDQWDWEKIISREDRCTDFLYSTVRAIVNAVCNVSEALKREFPQIAVSLSREVAFVTSQELEDRWPGLTPEERETAFVREHPTAFITQIGGALKSGKPHGCRAPDYDDWQLNGDLFFWHETLGCALEVSSMGIRVDSASLDRQLTIAGCDYRRSFPFHKMLLEGELPLTIGGGIGQSRLCMLMIGCAHIGEVQASLWDENTRAVCRESHIPLL